MYAKTTRVLLAVTFAVALLGYMSVPAMATPVEYSINVGNQALAGSKVAPPYADVTLNLSTDNKSVKVSVQMLGSYVLWGGNNVFGFNYLGGPNQLLLSNAVSGTGTALSFGKSSSEMSEFGKFDYVLQSSSKSNGKSLGPTLSFTLTRKDNGTFSSASDLAIGDSKTGSYAFALHLANCATCSSAVRVTGFAGARTQSAPAPVPEPGSLALLGAGLITLGGFMRHRRKKNA